ncbi:MAG: CvpA family protein [Dehalococcoidia bacterium]|nr:CvpA family protein [Dehalococcoidia bacterium]
MNWLDVIIIFCLVLFAFQGFRRGLTKSLAVLIGIILGILLAGALQNTLADALSVIDNESVAKIVAFAIILIVTFIAVYIVGIILQKILSITFLGLADRLGGGVFGFVVGWLICSVLIAVVARYIALPVDLPSIPVAGNPEEWLKLNGIREFAYKAIDGSAIASFQLDSFPVILKILPGEFDVVRDFFKG